jgi:hypothetical protein
MDCCCDDKTITVYKGFPTKWNGTSLIDVSFDTTIDLTNFSAIFKIGNVEKTYTDIAEGFNIDLTKEESGSLPVGLNYGELIIIDDETHKKPFTTALPFNVEDFVSGDIHLDNYNATVTTKIKKVPLTIKIETASIDPSIIREYIEEHNLDETAHPYIQGLIGQEVEAREIADGNLQTQINEISILANGYIHEQGVVSAVWTVQHNLNKYPSVTVVDSAENEIIAEVEYLDKNTVKITMSGESKGRAYLN